LAEAMGDVIFPGLSAAMWRIRVHPLCQRSCPPLYFSSNFQVGGIGQ